MSSSKKRELKADPETNVRAAECRTCILLSEMRHNGKMGTDDSDNSRYIVDCRFESIPLKQSQFTRELKNRRRPTAANCMLFSKAETV
jgi:hypothetical protein